MKGLNTISIDGLNVVPQKERYIAFPSISQYPYRSLETAVGDIKIKEVRLDGLSPIS